MPYDMEVLTYLDVLVYPSRGQKSEPVASHQLSICHNMDDTTITASRMNLEISSIRSSVLEFPFLSIILKTIGKAFLRE